MHKYLGILGFAFLLGCNGLIQDSSDPEQSALNTAGTTLLASVEAETMTLPSGATVVADSSASGGKAVQLTDSATLTGSVALTGNASLVLLKIRGERCQSAWPTYSLSVDGSVVATGQVSKSAWKTVVTQTILAQGTHAFALTLTNPSSSSSCHRALDVDVTSFYGTAGTTPPPPPPPPTGKVKVWAIGDSISAGNTDAVSNGYRYDLLTAVNAEGYDIDYVGSFQRGMPPLLDQDADVSGGSCIMTCAGQDSLFNDFTKPYLAQFNPDIVIMQGGGNDFAHASDAATLAKVEGFMQTWIEYFLAYNPNINLIVGGTTDYDTYAPYMAWLQQYAAQLQSQGKHVYYLSLQVETSDSVHPDATGYQQVTNNILPIINPILKTLTGTATPPSTDAGTPTLTGKPTAFNTGVPAGQTLTVVTDDQTFASDGAVISNRDFRGWVTVTGNNVTFKNCIFRGRAATSNRDLLDVTAASGTVVEDSEFVASNPSAVVDSCIAAANATVLRANIHGCVDGVHALGDNVTVKDSYIHDMTYFDSDPNQGGSPTHNDGVQAWAGVHNVILTHDNIDLSALPDGNSALQCSAFNTVVQDSWLDGGGCTLNFAAQSLGGGQELTGIQVLRNRFGRHQAFTGCAILISEKTKLAANSGNVWDDNGTPVPAPQQHD